MEFRILGPLEVVENGDSVPMGGQKQRALLAVLLVHRNEVVSTDRLIDSLWGAHPPATAHAALQVHVSQLRKLLGAERVETRPTGYRLRVAPDELDVARFELLLASETEERPARLREALALWRGAALADFQYEPWAHGEIARLDELRLEALEERIDADLVQGRHAQVVAELEGLVRDQPLRERPRAQLMLALYRSGRQAEALTLYQETRRLLVEELGIEPGQELHELHKRMLNQDPALAPPLGDELPAGPRVARERQTNIPVEPTPFLGRERELAEVLALLRRPDARIVTLTGPGGCGKSRLALRAASEVSGEHPNGVWWVPLQGLPDAELVLPSVAAALGAKDDLAEHLADRQLLLVLDNFEHVADAAPLLAELLSHAPGARVLTTSRERLHLSAEQDYAVAPLAADEAVGLFLARARAVDPGLADSDAVPEICRRLDNLPLALELAASRVSALPPAKLLERLERRLPILTGGARDLPERQRTLRATIEWSHQLLTDREQALFARLAVFSRGFALEAAEQVGDADLDTLQSLVDKSLLRREGDRFSMLETIREYAAEQLDESGEGESMSRGHAEHFVGEGRRVSPPGLTWEIEELTAFAARERDNLLAALSWAFDGGEPQLGLELVTLLWRAWLLGDLHTGRHFSEAALAHAAEAPEDERLWLVIAASEFARFLEDYGRAQELEEEALALARGLDARELEAGILSELGLTLVALGEPERALALLEEAITVSRAHCDAVGISHSLHQRGEALLRLGYPEDAARDFADALELVAERQSIVRATGLHSLGEAVRCTGDRGRARALFGEALELALAVAPRSNAVSDSLMGLAEIAVDEGDAERAAVVAGACDRLLDETGLLLSYPDQRTRVVAALEGALPRELIEERLADGRRMDIADAVRCAFGGGAEAPRSGARPSKS